jgi:hypothetical protein
MKFKACLFVLIAALLIPAAVRAQEGWGGERHEYFERLREACAYGDDRACWRLRQMRAQRRAREYGDWGERRGEGPAYGAAPAVNQKAAVCAAIRNNFNNCVARQQSHPWQNINCNVWPLQLNANGCF